MLLINSLWAHSRSVFNSFEVIVKNQFTRGEINGIFTSRTWLLLSVADRGNVRNLFDIWWWWRWCRYSLFAFSSFMQLRQILETVWQDWQCLALMKRIRTSPSKTQWDTLNTLNLKNLTFSSLSDGSVSVCRISTSGGIFRLDPQITWF